MLWVLTLQTSTSIKITPVFMIIAYVLGAIIGGIILFLLSPGLLIKVGNPHLLWKEP